MFVRGCLRGVFDASSAAFVYNEPISRDVQSNHKTRSQPALRPAHKTYRQPTLPMQQGYQKSPHKTYPQIMPTEDNNTEARSLDSSKPLLTHKLKSTILKQKSPSNSLHPNAAMPFSRISPHLRCLPRRVSGMRASAMQHQIAWRQKTTKGLLFSSANLLRFL